jgi:hypothetical protein
LMRLGLSLEETGLVSCNDRACVLKELGLFPVLETVLESCKDWV